MTQPDIPPVKLCKLCLHGCPGPVNENEAAAGITGFENRRMRCAHPLFISPVDGVTAIEKCYGLRRAIGGMCGPDGKLWEPKP